jgi:LytS/YehU family sensor histidine kinase
MYIFWFSSILIPITIANTYFTTYYLIPNYLIKKKYWQFLLYSIYALIGSAYIISLSMFFGFIFLSELDFKNMPPLSRSLPFILMSMYLIIIIVSSFKLLFYNYLALERHKTLENKYLQTQLQLKEEELKFLKMQIHPHFLFNTLNTLYGFALKKADETPDMILKLSNLLDYILYQIEKPFVPITEEINHIDDYIDLEKMRFNDTLDVLFNKQNIDTTLQIAPMLLIPFVENSFKHGQLINGILTIVISISVTKGVLVFKIKNSINDEQKNSKGIGLDNIKKRLEMLYPNQYRLDITQTKNEFEVVLELRK